MTFTQTDHSAAVFFVSGHAALDTECYKIGRNKMSFFSKDPLLLLIFLLFLLCMIFSPISPSSLFGIMSVCLTRIYDF